MNTPVTHFVSDEILSALTSKSFRRILEISVPRSMPERRIYLYLFAIQSAAGACRMDAALELVKDGQTLGTLPVNVANFTAQTPARSVLSVINAGGTPVGDSLIATLAQPGTGELATAVMQPLRINAEIDKISLDISGLSGVNLTGFRAILACLSTLY